MGRRLGRGMPQAPIYYAGAQTVVDGDPPAPPSPPSPDSPVYSYASPYAYSTYETSAGSSS